MVKLGNAFGRLAALVARASGKSATFLLAVGLIIVWALSGPFFGFSEGWQLVVNTAKDLSVCKGGLLHDGDGPIA